MKFKVLTSLVALALTAGIGCGDDTGTGANGGGSEGGGGQGGEGTGGIPVTSAGGGGEGGGGATGDGNDSFAEAIEMTPEQSVPFVGQGDLDPADSDADYFFFNGTAGDAILIGSDAKPDGDEFAEGYVDLVVELYNEQEQLIATNDDPFPRSSQDSSFYTVLPATGKYYLKVNDFCTWAGAGTCDDAYYDNLTDTAFVTYVIPLDPAEESNVAEAAEPNDTLANATVMEYAVADMPGQYYLSLAWGEYSTGDTDAIRFTVPADLVFEADSRANASLLVPPPGVDGSGSSVNPGILSVSEAVSGNVIAQFDMSARTADITARATLDFPVTPGTEYLLTNSEGPTAGGSGTPFYFVVHSVGTGNPVETQEIPNSLPATPEALAQAEGVDSYFIEGDLPTADVDYFRVAVLDETFTVACGSLRSGSGATGFKVSVLESDGTTELDSAVETVTTDLLIEDVDPGAETELIVKIEKESQDATNTGNFYRCGLHFAPPAQ